MAWLVFIVLAFVALTGAGIPGMVQRRSVDLDKLPAVPQAPVVVDPTGADSDSEREEMGLAEDVVTGMLPPQRYRSRMEMLAAQDANRLPVVVPPRWKR